MYLAGTKILMCTEQILIVLSLLESGNLADCTVVCKDRVWKVHSFLICPQSDFFKGAFTSGFKVGCSKFEWFEPLTCNMLRQHQEAKERKVDLSREIETVLDSFIGLFYNPKRDLTALGPIFLSGLY